MPWLRIAALVEASTLLLLLAASVAKRTLDFHEGVSILGPIHGIAFLAFVGLLLYERDERGITWLQTAFALIASVIPFGGFIADRKLIDQPAPTAA